MAQTMTVDGVRAQVSEGDETAAAYVTLDAGAVSLSVDDTVDLERARERRAEVEAAVAERLGIERSRMVAEWR